MPGRTIREAIAVALEGLSGDMFVWVVLAKQRDALRAHVVKWVHEYAQNRGVILSDADIESELAQVIAELRSGQPVRGRRYDRVVVYFGQKMRVVCDGRCDKAWGIHERPRVILSEQYDDFAWLADCELGEAPADPGTREGPDGKPRAATGPADMNRWCVRECERAARSRPGQHDAQLFPPDLSRRFYNLKPHRRD